MFVMFLIAFFAFGVALWLGKNIGNVLALLLGLAIIVAVIACYAIFFGIVAVLFIVALLGVAGASLGRRGAAFMRNVR